MVPLYSIIQDGHHDTFACVAQLPRSFGIQVTVVAVVLRTERANNLEGIELSQSPECCQESGFRKIWKGHLKK